MHSWRFFRRTSAAEKLVFRNPDDDTEVRAGYPRHFHYRDKITRASSVALIANGPPSDSESQSHKLRRKNPFAFSQYYLQLKQRQHWEWQSIQSHQWDSPVEPCSAGRRSSCLHQGKNMPSTSPFFFFFGSFSNQTPLEYNLSLLEEGSGKLETLYRPVGNGISWKPNGNFGRNPPVNS